MMSALAALILRSFHRVCEPARRRLYCEFRRVFSQWLWLGFTWVVILNNATVACLIVKELSWFIQKWWCFLSTWLAPISKATANWQWVKSLCCYLHLHRYEVAWQFCSWSSDVRVSAQIFSIHSRLTMLDQIDWEFSARYAVALKKLLRTGLFTCFVREMP